MMKKISYCLVVLLLAFFSLPLIVMDAAQYNPQGFEIRDSTDIEVLKEEWINFLSQNPNSTEEEQDKHLILFIENGGLLKGRDRSLGDYIPGYNRLNQEERSLALKHPTQLIKVHDDAMTATNQTEKFYGRNGWKDNSDAFRHCLWNALMTKSIGKTSAEQWATAHEYDSTGVDKEMDLFNNRIGRDMAVSRHSVEIISHFVKVKVKNGQCRRIVNEELVPTDGEGLLL